MNREKEIQDLINDPTYINWANNTNATDIKKWNAWASDNAARNELMANAKLMVIGLPFNKSIVPQDKINASWAKIESKIQPIPIAPIQEEKVLGLSKKWYWLLAAIISLSIAYYGYSTFSDQPEAVAMILQTDANSIKTFELPDGSKVTLNTNSKLSYDENFISQNKKILYLEGEAFFDIVKQKDHQKLIVRTDDIDVTVIGTEFNINDKRGTAIVSLNHGLVNLNVQGVKQNLHAGQTAFFDVKKEKYIIEEDMAAFWKSWISRKWSFGDGMKMAEICKRIEETYGIKCQIENLGILEKIAAGEVSADNKEILFQALSALLELKFKEQNGQLIISEL